MLVQPGLCRTCSETTLLVFPRGGSFLSESASYYHKDKLHLNSFGTQKLLRNLDAVHRVTRPNTSFQSAGQTRRNGSSAGVAGFQHKQRGYRNGRYVNGPRVNTQHHNGQKYCHICTISGHLTNDCWYNGRNTSMSGYFAH